MVEGFPNEDGAAWTWEEAREICREVPNGDLASIHSLKQNGTDIETDTGNHFPVYQWCRRPLVFTSDI